MPADPQHQTRSLIEAIDGGDSASGERLLELLYDELHRLADRMMGRERAGHTLQATALVHEAYLRLAGDLDWNGKAHFFGAASRAMRRVLVERARGRGRVKRGGGLGREPLRESAVLCDGPSPEILALDEALERLEAHDPRMGEIVHLRHFGGLSIEETAEALGLSVATVNRDWKYARAWLYGELRRGVE